MTNPISLGQIYTQAGSNLTRNYARLFRSQGQLMTGKRILRPSDGAIFTTQAEDDGLRSINPNTGEATVISDNTDAGRGNGLTFDLGEFLYLAADSDILKIDPTDGSSVLIGRLTFPGFNFRSNDAQIVAMTTRDDGANGTIFAIVKNRNKNITYLATVNLDTAVVTIRGENSSPVEGLACVPVRLFN